MPYTANRNRSQNIDIRGGVTPYKLEYQPSSEMFMNVVNSLNERQEKIKDVETSVAEAINKINLNPKEEAYRNMKIREYSDRIKANPMSLINAKQVARDAIDDKGLMARAKYQQRFEEITSKVKDRADISSDTKNWWLDKHKYDYQDITDSNGDIIGNTYEPKDMPYSDIKWDDAFKNAFGIVSPTSKGSSTSRSWSDNGTGGSSGSSSSVKEVTKQRITDTVNQWARDNAQAIEQARQVAEYTYKKELDEYYLMPEGEAKRAKLQHLEELKIAYGLSEDGKIDLARFKEFHINNSEYAKQMAYRWTDTSSNSSSYKSDATTGGSGGGLYLTEMREDKDGNLMRAIVPSEGEAVSEKGR